MDGLSARAAGTLWPLPLIGGLLPAVAALAALGLAVALDIIPPG